MAISISVLILAIGLISLFTLPVEQYPDIAPPTVYVTASYTGADAEAVMNSVIMPLEESINGVEDMMYISSSASNAGLAIIQVYFKQGTDPDMAAVNVQNRVAKAQGLLPAEVTKVGVSTMKRQTSFLQIGALVCTDGRYDQTFLANYLDINVIPQIKRIEGVGDVMELGDTYSMRIWLKPERMAQYGLVPSDITAILGEQNIEAPTGSLGESSKNVFQFTMKYRGRLKSVEEFQNTVVRSREDGSILRLKDVARIELGSSSYNVTSKLKGQPSAAIAIYQLPGSNSLEVAKGVRAKMEQLADNLPEGVVYDVTLDTTQVINASIDEVLVTFLETTALVILVIFLFLQNFRAVIIPCITIPVSLMGTLAVMSALGFSINTLTLFGLILAIAIVVDDAIVVVENSSRLMDTGKYTAREAVTEAMGEIVDPIVGVVLVLLAVFIPTTFISGISGQLYKQFALTIAAATVLSGFNSLTLTPALCALFLQANKEPKFFVFKAFNKVFGKTQKIYDDIVGRMLKNPFVTMVIFGIITAIAIVMFMRWPTTFIPEEDDGYFLISTQLPPAASLNRTEAVGKQIDKILDSYPEIKTYIGVNGFSIMGGGELSNAGTYFVILKNWNERKGKEHTASAVVNRFNREAYGIQEAQIFAMVPPAIPGLGASGGLQLQLEDRNNLGPTEMQHAIETLQATYRSKPQLLNLSSMYQANVPQYNLAIDRDKVQLLGLQLNQVFSTLSYYMGATYVNDFVEFGRIYQVKIEANDQAQKVIDDVLHLSLENNSGKMVPFSAFTEVKEQLGLDQINLYNMYKSASITCIANPKYSSGEAIQAMEELVQEQLGNNFGYEWTSVAYQETKAGSTTMLVFAMALLVAFLVLSAQYESWTSPIAAIMGLPIALLGTILGCFVMGVPVSIYTQIGIILLIALSAKNGILIVEFARDYHKAGNPIRESALEAGHIRLRPILMTSFAFVLGVMPLLFATGAGARSRLSLGAAVVFGMAVNTIFATMFIPSFYELMQLFQEKVLDKFSRKQK